METQVCPILMGMAPEEEMVKKPTHRRQADKDLGWRLKALVVNVGGLLYEGLIYIGTNIIYIYI